MKTIIAIWAAVMLAGAAAAYPGAPAPQASVNSGVGNFLWVTPQTLGVYMGIGACAYLAQQGVSVEQFGAKADGKANFDFQTTAGACTVVSPSSTFTTADLGKWMVVYYSIQDTNYLLGQITNIVSATTVNVNSNAQFTVSGQEGRWGTDNASNINSCINWSLGNNNHNIVFSNGVYFVVGTPTLTASNMLMGGGSGEWTPGAPLPIYSVIQVGVSTNYHSYAGGAIWTNSTIFLSFIGIDNGVDRTTGYFQGQRKGVNGGSIIYYPGVGTHNGGQDYLVSMSSSNNCFSVINTEWRNLKFLHPNYATESCIDNLLGGAISVDHCTITGDWNGGESSLTAAQQEGLGGTNVYAIHLAASSNNGNQFVKDCELDGGYNGIWGSDHSYLTENFIVRQMIGYVPGGGGEQMFNGTEFDVNATNFWLGEGQGITEINGTVIISRDDFSQAHGQIWEPAAVNYVSGNLYVHDDQPGLFSPIVGVTGYPSLNVMLDGWLSESGNSNYVGATFVSARFPSGATFPAANASAQWSCDWTNAWVIGTINNFIPSLGYNSQYKQFNWNASQAASIIQYRSQPQNAVESTYYFDTGNQQWNGTLYGNGAGLTNICYPTNFAKPTVPNGMAQFWVSNGWVYYLTTQHPNGVLITAP